MYVEAVTALVFTIRKSLCSIGLAEHIGVLYVYRGIALKI